MAAPGFVMVARAAIHTPGLSGYAKLLYVLLQSRVDKDGWCYPSLATLATDSGWSRPTVIKAIGELIRAGLVAREHRRYVNGYRLTESTSFTPSAPNGVNGTDSDADGVKDVYCEAAVGVNALYSDNGRESTSFTPSPVTVNEVDPVGPDGVKEVDSVRSTGGTESTSFTDGVNDVYTNENHLTRGTGTSTGDTSPGIPGAAASSRGRAREATAIPAGLTAFDAVLRESRGYCPTTPFYAKVQGYQDRGLDIDEQAIMMAGWLGTRPKKQASAAFVLGWLKREMDRGTSGQDSGRAYRHGGAGKRGPDRPAGAYDEFARYSIRSDDPRLARRPIGPLAPGDSGAR